MTTRPGRIGILGGTFDPFHLGHLEVARAARATLALDAVRIVTCAVPPHRRKPSASPPHRFAMVALGIVAQPGLLADDIELEDEEPSYTVVTLSRLHAQGFRPEQLFFITGADAFAEIATWREYPRVLKGAHFVVVARPGRPAWSLRDELAELAPRMRVVSEGGEVGSGGSRDTSIFLVDLATPDVSSTEIRRRAAAGASLEGLVPALVAGHILRHQLYRTNPDVPSRTPGTGAAASELHEQEPV
jgi:nicotinate-nucleotide adenylyltransferase